MTDHESLLPLGKETVYSAEYDPELLCPFPRQVKRSEIGVSGELPFGGYDLWNAFELSWLNGKGKPVVAMGEFLVPCTSPNLIESKSFKLYLNSFNQTRFTCFAQVEKQMATDLSQAAGGQVGVRLFESHQFHPSRFNSYREAVSTDWISKWTITIWIHVCLQVLLILARGLPRSCTAIC